MTRREHDELLAPFLIFPSERREAEDSRRCELETDFLLGQMDDDEAEELRGIYAREHWKNKDLPFFQGVKDCEVPSEEMKACLQLDE